MISVNFNLRDPNIENTTVVLTCRWGRNKVVRATTGLSIYVASWDKKMQRCFTSREKFSEVVNAVSIEANKFLDELKLKLDEYFLENKFNDYTLQDVMKNTINIIISSLKSDKKAIDEKMSMTPLVFFEKFIEEKKIDNHTGRLIAERTKIHQRTVLKRIKKFFADCHLLDDWSVFRSSKFDAKYTNWCFKQDYKINTVYATYGVLKPWLNAARVEGFDCGDHYRLLKGKGVDVDAVYLTEEEVTKIFNLDIPSLIKNGIVDNKSTMEQTRDVFIIGCWTGLRRSDLNRLNEAVFDAKNKLIILTTEKTKKKVIIPMHPYVVSLYNKYDGNFPTLGTRSHTNEHIKELGRLAGVDEIVSIVENRGGVVKTLKMKKYEMLGTHTARRSFATNMFKRGFPSISIMQITGHTTEANFLKYIKVSAEENAKMVAEKFECFFKDL